MLVAASVAAVEDGVEKVRLHVAVALLRGSREQMAAQQSRVNTHSTAACLEIAVTGSQAVAVATEMRPGDAHQPLAIHSRKQTRHCLLGGLSPYVVYQASLERSSRSYPQQNCSFCRTQWSHLR